MSVLSDVPALRRLKPVWRTAVDDYPVALAWAPDGETLAVGEGAGAVSLYDRSGQRKQRFDAHADGLLDLSWSQDGAALVTAGQDGRACVWDGSHCRTVLEGRSQWLEHLVCAPHADVVAVADGRQVRFWRLDGEPLMDCAPEAYTLLDLQWLPDGSVLTAAYGGVSRWRLDHVRAISRYPWKGALLALAASPDGARVAAGLQEAGVHYWCLDSGDPLYMRGYDTKVRALSWDPTGRYLATGGGASVVIWDCGGDGPAGSEPLELELHVKPITALAFAPQGWAMASGSRDGSAVIVNPGADTAAATLTREHAVTDLAWDPLGERVAFAFADGGLAVCPGAPTA